MDPLVEYVRLAVAHGPDSNEAVAFRSRHWHDREFQAKARLVDHLLRQAGPPPDWPAWLK